MSLNVLRAPIRRAAFCAPFSKARLRPSFRHYSTPPPERKSNLGLYAGLGVAVLGAAGLYLYTSKTGSVTEATGALKANFKPTREDYQKVRAGSSYSIINLPRRTLGVQQDCLTSR
jgi:hypothetical protein